MPAEPVIDVERLLQPCSESQPCGIELQETDSLFNQIKGSYDHAVDLTNKEIEKEESGGIDDHGVPLGSMPKPDWGPVVELGVEVLENQSKDFRVAGWITEALLRTKYFLGLRDGLRLCWGLCERYWDSIHPAPDELGGHITTVSGFTNLLRRKGRLAILQCPIVCGVKPKERETRQYSSLDYQRAQELEEMTDETERKRRIENGQIELSEFKMVAIATPAEYFRTTLEAIDESIDLLNQLGEFLNEKCLADEYGEATSPSVTEFREELEKVRNLVRELGGKSTENGATSSSDQEESESTGSEDRMVLPQQQEMTRESAFQAIESIAQFFERNEPHSPVHFALRQAVRWGRAPLPDLLAELIEDRNVMQQLQRQIGLPPTDDH